MGSLKVRTEGRTWEKTLSKAIKEDEELFFKIRHKIRVLQSSWRLLVSQDMHPSIMHLSSPATSINTG